MKLIDSMLICKNVKLDRSPNGPLNIAIARNNMMPQNVADGNKISAFITVDLSISQKNGDDVIHIGDLSVKYMFLADIEDELYQVQSCAEELFDKTKVLFFHTVNSLLCDVRLPVIKISQLDSSNK